MRANQYSKQKINLYFFVQFVCVNYKKLLAGYTDSCILLDYVMKDILFKGDYWHAEDVSLQNTEEYKFFIAINWLKSVHKFIKDNNNKNPTRD